MTPEDYVSYPVALALKKAGFDYPCYFFYTRMDAPEDHVWSTTSEEAPIDYNRSVYAGCSMPTLAQAQKWLREKCGIHIDVCIYSDYSTDADGEVCDKWDFWGFDLYVVAGGKKLTDDDGDYDSYEQALSAGIAAALELIEKEGCSNPSVVNCKHKHGDGTCSLGSMCCHKSPKPAEPKFKVGDKVRVITHQGEATPLEREICEIIDIDKYDPICTYYLHNFSGEWYSEFDLEPYTEPDTSHERPVCENHSDDTSQKEVKVNSNRNLSKNIAVCDKQFDNILKDSFSKERRLNVAVQMIKAMMGCPEIIDRISSAVTDSLLDDILHDALHLTDRLIDECEKGGKS